MPARPTSAPLNRRRFLELAALLPLIAVAPRTNPRPHVPAAPGQPNVVILVYDALSASSMSLYGYPRATTPQMERFAKQATVYHRHYASGNFTNPGTASLLTGVLPWTHRALHIRSIALPRFEDQNLFSAFDNGDYYRFAYTHNPLAGELLSEFHSGIDAYKNPDELYLYPVDFAYRLFPKDFTIASWSEYTLLRGTDYHRPASLFGALTDRLFSQEQRREANFDTQSKYPDGTPEFGWFQFRLEDAIDWMIGQLKSAPQPYLAYVHMYPPHYPYRPRLDFQNKFKDGWSAPVKPMHHFGSMAPNVQNDLRRTYDQYVAFADSEFGRLLDAMQQMGTLDNTIFAFTSDHGESFERGIVEHAGETLHEPIMRVPLLISTPGQKERKDVYTFTSAIDVLPTLTSAVGLPTPSWGEGIKLPEFGGAPPADRSIIAVEAKANSRFTALTKATLAMIKGRYKLHSYYGYPDWDDKHELYDLENDPEELQDLYTLKPDIARDLLNDMQTQLAAANSTYRKI